MLKGVCKTSGQRPGELALSEVSLIYPQLCFSWFSYDGNFSNRSGVYGCNFCYVIKAHLHTCKGTQRHNSRWKSPAGCSQAHCQRAISPSKSHLCKPREQAQQQMGNPNEGFRGKDTLSGPLPAEPQSHCPGVKLIMMSHWDKICMPPFEMKECCC